MGMAKFCPTPQVRSQDLTKGGWDAEGVEFVGWSGLGGGCVPSLEFFLIFDIKMMGFVHLGGIYLFGDQ